MILIWSKKVSKEFSQKLLNVAAALIVNPNHLMASMSFETGRTFSPSVTNSVSGAIGLIQFMPKSTCPALGISPDGMKALTAVQQLDYVHKYFLPYKGKLKSLEDVYMAILLPSGVGKPLNHVLFRQDDAKYRQRYVQNKGLDYNKDGFITKQEAAAKVQFEYKEGLKNSDPLINDYLTSTPVGQKLIQEVVWTA